MNELNIKMAEVKNEFIKTSLVVTSYEGEYGVDECKKQESVYFLKTFKMGSTTIANILSRFGYSRNKSFLLGETSNGGLFFKNLYLPFTAETCFLGRDIPNRPKIDISACHMSFG